MDIIQTYLRLLDKPTVPKFYRQLRDAYRAQGRVHEAEAVSHLIEKRFGKNHDEANDSPGREEQRRDGGADA